MCPSRALVVFARTPEAEARAKGLSIGRAVPVFEAAIVAWIRAARAAGADAIIACDAADLPRLAAIAGDVAWIAQPEGSFGARLSAVATIAFGRGYARVALTGIDTPAVDLTAIFARDANVIVPACDGGVNLICLVADAPELLRSLRTRQADAAAHCANALDAIVLARSADVDDSGDLDRLLATLTVFAPRERIARSRHEPPSPSLRAPPSLR